MVRKTLALWLVPFRALEVIGARYLVNPLRELVTNQKQRHKHTLSLLTHLQFSPFSLTFMDFPNGFRFDESLWTQIPERPSVFLVHLDLSRF